MQETLERQNIITPNEKQLECIEHLDGPVMVLAGPGTGKTFTIIERIKYMLNKGIIPESILCLTYSEAAANEMKIRLVKECGTSATAVSIHTYHAFCSEVIKHNPAEFELMEGLEIADDITKQTIMTEVVKEYKPEYHLTRWGDSEYFVPELLEDVNKIKQSGISKEQYFHNLSTHPLWQGKMDELDAELKEREEEGKPLKTFMSKYERHQKKMGKAKEAWEIYELYDKKLKQKNFIDFNDMINMVLDVFNSDDELLKRTSKKYKYFLVDEYQDTNYSQNNIVFKLAEGTNVDNIFVVGDDDQIIYEFQGAKTDTLAKFLERYPHTKVICLNENNRSTQTILDFSYKVISQDETRLENNPKFKAYNIDKKLYSKNDTVIKKERPINFHIFSEASQEYNYIVSDIEKLIKSEDCPVDKSGKKDLSSIAILTRNNAEIAEYAQLLRNKNIKYQIKITRSIFEMKPSILLYFYLKALYNPEFFSDKLFGLLGAEPFAFEPEDYGFLLREHRLNHKNFIENIRLNLDRDWKNRIRVTNFIETYDRLKAIQSAESLKNLIISVCNYTGILEYFVKSDVDRIDNIMALKRVIDEAGALKKLRKGAGLKEFIEHLDSACELNIPITIEKDNYTQNAVQLLTLHGSKGRQFDYVYIPNLVASKWENKRNINDTSLPINSPSDFIDDDKATKSELLRLLFVGITRAKYGLTISYSNSINNKGEEFTTYLSEVVTESKNSFNIQTHELSKEELSFEFVKSIEKTHYDCKSVFKDEIETRIQEIILSPSTLNSYLNCPREFFYTHVLKIPIYEKSWDTANYGSAFHKTLENASRQLLSIGKYPTEEEFITDFNRNLAKHEFESEESRNKYKQRGEERLRTYYPHFIETSADRLDNVEFTFDATPIDGEIITGKIDRIEKTSDGTYCLFDYKTGSAKPKSQIADGKDYEKYLNQLRFYKLAYETINEDAKVSRVGLIFPEEFDKNFYTELTQTDNEIIKNKILETYKNMRLMKFEPTDDEKACEYCSYKQLCKLNIL